MVHPAILGHEFTHGIVQTSQARLDASKEARGLDEGTADFFGQMIDTWSRTGGGNPATRLFSNLIGDRDTPWTYTLTRAESGESFVFRDLAEPSRVGHPDRWFPEIGRLPDEHAPAGPLNRALCFLSRGAAAVGSPEAGRPRTLNGAPAWTSDLLPGGMAGIGNDRTAAIWYHVLTEELQPRSDYRDARRAALRDVEDNVVLSRETGFTLANAQHQVLRDPSLVDEDDASGGWVADATLECPSLPPPGRGAEGMCRRFDATTLRPGKYPLLSQMVTLPAVPARLLLSLWVQVQPSSDPRPEDSLVVHISPTSHAPAKDLVNLTPAHPTEGWKRLTFPLDAFAGQTVALRFKSHFQEGSSTVFRVADVRILASDPPAPGPATEPVPR